MKINLQHKIYSQSIYPIYLSIYRSIDIYIYIYVYIYIYIYIYILLKYEFSPWKQEEISGERSDKSRNDEDSKKHRENGNSAR